MMMLQDPDKLPHKEHSQQCRRDPISAANKCTLPPLIHIWIKREPNDTASVGRVCVVEEDAYAPFALPSNNHEAGVMSLEAAPGA